MEFKPTKEQCAELAKLLISDETMRDFVQREMPARLECAIGDDSFAPELNLLLASADDDDSNRHGMIMIKIMHNDFNEKRYELLRNIGADIKHKGHQVVAACLSSEAWVKTMNAAEAEQRGKREVASYDDKEEVLMTCGLTIDRRAFHHALTIERGEDARFTGFTARQEMAPDGLKIPILESFFTGYLQAKFPDQEA